MYLSAKIGQKDSFLYIVLKFLWIPNTKKLLNTTPECDHKFVCPSSENYIGQTKRQLNKRKSDYFKLSKISCPHYKRDVAKKKINNSLQYLKPQQINTIIRRISLTLSGTEP